MSPKAKIAIGVLVGLVVWVILPIPGWVTWLGILGIIGLPVVGYLMLDPSQRKRLRKQTQKRIGS